MENQPMQQNYGQYTAEPQQVWQALFHRQVDNLQGKAIPALWPCIERASEALHGSAVPRFSELDQILLATTGWQIEVVPGLIPVGKFFELLAQRRFPSSTWLRSKEQFDYLEEPDMFHDIFGHVPLLFDERYADFMQRIGKLGLNLQHDEAWIKALERFYWFTIEFGICQEAGQHQIIGAGILSSFGETNQIFEPDTCEFRPFDLEAVLNHHFYKHDMQTIYYVLPSYEAMFDALQEVEQRALQFS